MADPSRADLPPVAEHIERLIDPAEFDVPPLRTPERRLRKRIYVADYIRGPEDAPLVIKPKVVRV